MGGDYRHMLIKPTRVDYKVISYANRSADLSKSDWDLLKEKENKKEASVELQNNEGIKI